MTRNDDENKIVWYVLFIPGLWMSPVRAVGVYKYIAGFVCIKHRSEK